MKTSFLFLLMIVGVRHLHTQSSIEYQSGTSIEVTSGADICADDVMIIGSFSGEGTQCNSALPVELVFLSVAVTPKGVELRWSTATETNNFGFEIEWRTISHPEQVSEANASKDASTFSPKNVPVNQFDWSRLGFVEGNGATNSPKEYSFRHTIQRNGKYLFRLKQIDRDGGFVYSQEVEITTDNVPEVFSLHKNYPNPFNPSTTIGFTLEKSGITTLTIYDAIGREVTVLVNDYRDAGAYHYAVFNAAGFSSGIYFARLQSGKQMQIQRMMLVK